MLIIVVVVQPMHNRTLAPALSWANLVAPRMHVKKNMLCFLTWSLPFACPSLVQSSALTAGQPWHCVCTQGGHLHTVNCCWWASGPACISMSSDPFSPIASHSHGKMRRKQLTLGRVGWVAGWLRG